MRSFIKSVVAIALVASVAACTASNREPAAADTAAASEDARADQSAVAIDTTNVVIPEGSFTPAEPVPHPPGALMDPDV